MDFTGWISVSSKGARAKTGYLQSRSKTGVEVEEEVVGLVWEKGCFYGQLVVAHVDPRSDLRQACARVIDLLSLIPSCCGEVVDK